MHRHDEEGVDVEMAPICGDVPGSLACNVTSQNEASGERADGAAVIAASGSANP